MTLSKNKIDAAGQALAKTKYRDLLEQIQHEDNFNEYRKQHLQPLSETTIELQKILSGYGGQYYIAQRLKRKPQIIRKLRRLSVRLSQLQDIGGCRIIVRKNTDVDSLLAYLKDKTAQQNEYSIEKITDYRDLGRDDTGYRALHIILRKDNYNLELQIRSRIQHYWAESIERTSVIYGYHLKEKEGAKELIDYFKTLSDVFYEIESGRHPSTAQQIKIDSLRQECEKIIRTSDRYKIFDSYVNEDIIKTLIEKEKKNKSQLNNWILVFDWNSGAFVSWDIVGRDPNDAVKKYIENEDNFPAEQGFEVVLIGSSEVATVSKTHSHYFGIETYNDILESLDSSIVGFARRIDIDVGARQILVDLHRRNFWGKKTIKLDTLRNHFCKNVLTFDSSLKSLTDKGLVVITNDVCSLNIKRKPDIEQYV